VAFQRMARLTRFDPAERVAAILGAADGLTIAVSLIFGRTPAVFHAALDAGVGEFVGMGAALYLSDAGRKIFPAILCGAATLIACVLPAIPYVTLGGWPARLAGTAIAAAEAGVIYILRPEKGWLAAVETWGVIALAGGLCLALSFA
jgi:hypothetical protein